MLTSWLVDRHFKTLLLEGKQSPPGTLHDNSCGSGSSSPTPDESQAVLNPVLRCHTISRLSLAVLSPVDTLFTAVQNVVFHTQLLPSLARPRHSFAACTPCLPNQHLIPA
ncbi:hypothetical protein IG631_04013 [Alternaria alternata]|nr:hypothetical protein IG631_04013 [Alternaria alternata]